MAAMPPEPATVLSRLHDLLSALPDVFSTAQWGGRAYKVPGPGGDGECVIFYFGPGQGGDAMSNALRWANQFSQPDGRTPQEAMKTETLDVGGIAVLLTEVTGTYSGGMTMMTGTSANLANHMLLGAIAQGGDANWFFKLTGPEATLGPQRDAFRSMLESLRRGG